MSKSIKLKNNNYWDSSSIVHNQKTLNTILNLKDVVLLYSNEEGLVANPSASFSCKEPCTRFNLLLVYGKKDDQNVLGTFIPILDTTLSNNGLNFYTFNYGYGVTVWYETIYQVIGICRK